eukprot:345612-Pelagomonas_calceolata.AAC.1
MQCFGMLSQPDAGTQCTSLLNPGMGRKEKKGKKNYVGRGNSPYINQGKRDTLAQKSRESPPPPRWIKIIGGDLEGYLRHPAPKHGCEKYCNYQ